MKITVRHKDTEIVIDEGHVNNTTSIRWGDQNILIQETIRVMCDQVKKLHEQAKQ